MAKAPQLPPVSVGPDWLNAILERTQNRDDLVVNIAERLKTEIDKSSSLAYRKRDIQITSPAQNRRRVILKDYDGETDVVFSLEHTQIPNHEKGRTDESFKILVDVKASALIGQDHKTLAGHIESVLKAATLRNIDMHSVKNSLIRSYTDTNGMQSTALTVNITDSEVAQDVAGQAVADLAADQKAQDSLAKVVDDLTR